MPIKIVADTQKRKAERKAKKRKKNIEDIVYDTATENIFSKFRTKLKKAEKQYKDIPSGMKKDPKTYAGIKTKLLKDKSDPFKEFKDTRRKVFATQRMAKGGRAGYNIGGRANLLEEMGRIDARRHPDAADSAEKRRVIGEVNKGYKSGGAVLKGKKVGCQIK